MDNIVNIIIALIVITNFMLLGTSSLQASIRITAFQGLVIGSLPLFVHFDGFNVRIAIIAILVITLKSYIIPRYLRMGLREQNTVPRISFYIGPTASLLIGVLVMSSSLWWGYVLPLPEQSGHHLVIPMVFFTIVTGIFLVIGRKQTLMQIIGYLTLENGIYTFGVYFTQSESMLIEVGILLDVFVGVFIMGIMLFDISRIFDDIDSGQMSTLKDWSRYGPIEQDEESAE